MISIVHYICTNWGFRVKVKKSSDYCFVLSDIKHTKVTKFLKINKIMFFEIDHPTTVVFHFGVQYETNISL